MVAQGYSIKKSSQQYPIWQGNKPLLSNLDIELTERCNNACQHCYINRPADDVQAKKGELNTNDWQEILRQAAELGVISVRFTGGEPLLREDFSSLYLYARQAGLRVLLFTNARLISQEQAELFTHIPPLHDIEVTVYGMHPESYDAAACTPGAYEEFLKGVNLLLEYQIPFLVKGALLPCNLSEMDEFEAWAARLPWMDEPPTYAMFFDLRARRDSSSRNRLISRLRLSPEEGVSVLKRRGERQFREMEEFCSRFMGPAGAKLFGCGAGHKVSVDAYGQLQPCLLLRDPSLIYNLRRGTLREGLDFFSTTLGGMRATNPAYLERCAVCFLHGLCEQCPAKSWVEHGTLDTPVEYLCEVAHAQARDLGLLAEGEKAWEVRDWKSRIARLKTATGENG